MFGVRLSKLRPRSDARPDADRAEGRTDHPRPAHETAASLLSDGQRRMLVFGSIASLTTYAAAVGLQAAGVAPTATDLTIALLAIVTIVYVAVMVYRTVLVRRSLKAQEAAPAPVASTSPGPVETDTAAMADGWPRYTILVPLFREGSVVRTLMDRLDALDYPPDRLQTLLLIEHDDDETLAALQGYELPVHVEVVVVPAGGPKTKPNACNVGLARCDGEFCVIYDAEDRPEPDQLKLAVQAFANAPSDIVCVQARLTYWNPNTNVLTRWFAAEYALNFDLVLPGLTSLGHPVPLGGTSNHFRADALRSLGGWDALNVTEDADLGLRIARAGRRVAMMDSVTWEEANSSVPNWIRQRSRWVKGYMQTWLVHVRSPRKALRDLGPMRFLSINLLVGGTPLTLLLNPVFWALTLTYVLTRSHTIEELYPAPVFYLGIASMAIGNFLFLYMMMLGAMERRFYGNVKWMMLVPVYWLLMSVAAYKALSQLMRKNMRHYWEKTEHGLVADDATLNGELRVRGGRSQDVHTIPQRELADILD